jgi:hypothetical protein
MRNDRKRGKRWLIVPSVLVILAATGLVLAFFNVGGISLTSQRLYDKLAYPVLRLLCYLAAGLLIGQLIEGLGWTAKVARWVSPLTRWGHLKPESGAAFVSSFVSGIVANTMLMGLHQEGKLTRKELVLSYLVNNGLPIFLVHLPTTFVIVVSLAGKAGLVYLCITFSAACLRTVGALLFTRVTMPAPQRTDSGPEAAAKEAKTKATNSILKTFHSRFIRIVLYTIPIYVLIFLLNEWGVFMWLRKGAAGLLTVDFFPVEAASVIVFAVAAEFSSGFAAAGALLDAGTLSVKQASIALIVGTIASSPIRAVRHQLPTHTGIFSLKLGGELLLLSQSLRVVSLILVSIPYIIWG